MTDAARATNIGPAQCRRRLMVGGVALLAAAALLAALLHADAPRVWRLLLLLPLMGAGLGFFQHREKT